MLSFVPIIIIALCFRSSLLSSLQTLSVSHCVALTSLFFTAILPAFTQLKQLEMRGVFTVQEHSTQKMDVRDRLDLAIFEHEEQLKYSSSQVFISIDQIVGSCGCLTVLFFLEVEDRRLFFLPEHLIVLVAYFSIFI